MNWAIKQRLNFYTSEFRPPALPEDIARLLWRLGLMVLLLVVLMLGVWLLQLLAAGNAQHWQQQQKLATQALQEEQLRRPQRREDPQLLQQRDAAKAQLRRSQQVLSYLSRDQLQQSQSFRLRVEQLAAVPVSGVWLQRFMFSAGGAHIRLEGQLSDPALLASYVAALSEQSAYRHHAFRQVDVQRSEQSALQFVLDSRAQAVAEETP